MRLIVVRLSKIDLHSWQLNFLKKLFGLLQPIKMSKRLYFYLIKEDLINQTIILIQKEKLVFHTREILIPMSKVLIHMRVASNTLRKDLFKRNSAFSFNMITKMINLIQSRKKKKVNQTMQKQRRMSNQARKSAKLIRALSISQIFSIIL